MVVKSRSDAVGCGVASFGLTVTYDPALGVTYCHEG
jgi:hypothetical protein